MGEGGAGVRIPNWKKKKMRISITLLNCFPFLNYCLIFWITINGDFSTKIFELSYFHHIFLVLRRPTTCSGLQSIKIFPPIIIYGWLEASCHSDINLKPGSLNLLILTGYLDLFSPRTAPAKNFWASAITLAQVFNDWLVHSFIYSFIHSLKKQVFIEHLLYVSGNTLFQDEDICIPKHFAT